MAAEEADGPRRARRPPEEVGVALAIDVQNPPRPPNRNALHIFRRYLPGRSRAKRQREIAAIASAHAEWIDSGGARGARAELVFADLRHLNLEGFRLPRADLRGADLVAARATGADFADAQLESADLRCADLDGADFTRADLRTADCRDARFEGAALFDADLRCADLRGADFTRADLRNAVCYAALLQDADVSTADLRGADLADTVLGRKPPGPLQVVRAAREAELAGRGSPER